MKILIPMAGQGKRFLAAGYELPKPLIEVEGRPIIEHILRNFSPDDEFVFGINHEHEKKFQISSRLKQLVPHARFVFMDYQAGGPVSSVEQMFGEIRDDEPVIVNYCDFSWRWDYKAFKHAVVENKCDGAVACYTGFHPHLLGPNKYATLDADGPWMKEIREKHSWHDDKQKDWTSSGTYYFRRGEFVKKYFRKIHERAEWKINNEFYVSQVYQLMKEDGLKIYIQPIEFMLQWGTPEDLAQYVYWSNYFRRKAAPHPAPKTYPMTVLMLMAGAGKRFSDAGYQVPKPYIPVDSTTMIEASTRSLPRGERYVFVTRDADKKVLSSFPDAQIVVLDKLTEGQASTALLAADKLDPEKPLLIGACDHSLIYQDADFAAATANAEALIFTYRNNPMVRLNPHMYGWVEVEGDRATHVSVKVPLAGDPASHHAIIGAFWFRKAKYFLDACRAMIEQNSRVNNEFYIDQAMNFVIQAGRRVDVFEVEAYASWGTPNDLKTYEYWQHYFSSHPAPLPRGVRGDHLSVVVPCYNEEKNIPALVRNFAEAVGQRSDIEVLFVDNGSRDETGKILDREIKDKAFAKKVTVPQNQGYGYGILAGLEQAKGNILAWTHADLQTDPADVIKALELYRPNSLVKGVRKNRPWADAFFSGGMQLFASATLGASLSEINAQPKLFSRAFYESIKAEAPHDFSLDLYFLYQARKNGYAILTVPVYFKPRLHGEAKGGGGSNLKTKWKLIKRTLAYTFKLREQLHDLHSSSH